MRKIIIVLFIIVISSCQKKADVTNFKRKVSDPFENKYILVPPYQESNICSIFSVSEKGIISERFQVFDTVCSTSIFSKIDSICSIGIKALNEEKTIYLEYWKLRDSAEVLMYKSKLDSIKNINNLKYKPPTFWMWKSQDNVLLFFYSQEVSPSDPFFTDVYSNYKKIIGSNCCESWAKL